MSNELIFISVVIPTYDRIDILEKYLEGFENQSHPKEIFEVIVVDAG